MRRFLIAQVPAVDTFPLPATWSHRLVHVLRMRPGTALELATPDGAAWRVEIVAASGDRVVVRKLRPAEPVGGRTAPRVTVYQAVPKARKLEQLVQDCTELGAARITPVFTERTVVRWDPDKMPGRLARLNSIAWHAAEQSCRSRPPEISPPQPFAETVAGERSATRLLLTASPEAPRLGGVVETASPPAAVLIGPEGGFSPAELQAAENHGWEFVSLGPRILRTETAAPAALAVILDRWER